MSCVTDPQSSDAGRNSPANHPTAPNTSRIIIHTAIVNNVLGCDRLSFADALPSSID